MTLDTTTTRVDMHCHSTASQISKLGVQRALGLPECATPPEEVYALAKRRGMDFVTITDHDTIDGVLEIADRPDVFVSEELTAHFRGEPQAVHVLCYGITPEDHSWLQANSGDVELCDVETGRTLRQPLRRDTVARFRAFFRGHCDQLRGELRRYGVRYLRLASDQDLDQVLFTRFPREGVFR